MSTWAERQQPHTTVLDVWLLERARTVRPTVAWWWGRGRRNGTLRLICYVCGEQITPSAAAYQLPKVARDEVMRHRAAHYDGTALPKVDGPMEART